jgi:DNA-binding CsgD family transcriptional regulator
MPLLHQPWWIPLHVEALIGTGQLSAAKETLSRLVRLTRDVPCLRTAEIWLTGAVAAAEGDIEKARRQFEGGLALPHAPDDPPLHRALLEQAYGRTLEDPQQQDIWLNRARNRFSSMEALPFVRRCDEDLTASHESRAFGRSDSYQLTKRERDIAHLIGRGYTNKEIATELFISTKTVEYHLGNIYARLNLTSRRQLRDRVQRHLQRVL